MIADVICQAGRYDTIATCFLHMISFKMKTTISTATKTFHTYGRLLLKFQICRQIYGYCKSPCISSIFFLKMQVKKSGMRLIYGNIKDWTSSHVMSRVLLTFQNLATNHLCVLFQLLPSNFNFRGRFEVVILEK